MSSISKQKEQKLLSMIKKNSNVQFLSELQKITPDMTGKDLTEEQKMAFIAMMRIACDPKDKTWSIRKKKLDRKWAARTEAAAKERKEMRKQTIEERVVEKSVEGESKDRVEMKNETITAREVVKKRESLKMKIKRMRAERRFPMQRERREDSSRRYGFIPPSQKKADIAEYRKA
nr:uncharacterized protein LOC109422042 [Aedes albopictus]